MKRFGVIIGLVLALVFGAAVAAPFLIDINQYKGQIENAAQDALGREVKIKGDISIGFLTGLKLGLDQLVIANDDQGDADSFLTMEEARVSIALMPLLSGTINVTEVLLSDPVIHFEQFSDGTNNLPLPAEESGESDADASTDTSASDELPYNVVIGALTIENGTVHYHDHVNATTEQVTIPELTVSLESLDGPFSLEGQIVAMGQNIGLSVDVGNIKQDKTRIRADVTLLNGAGQTVMSAKVSGLAANLETAPQFTGSLNLLGGADDLITVSFNNLSAGTTSFATGSGIVALGGNKFDVSASGSLADMPDITVSLKAGRVDLEALLASITQVQEFASSVQPRGEASVADRGTDAGQDNPSTSNPLPQNVRVAFDLSVDALAMNDDAVRQIALGGVLADGQLKLIKGGAQLPGSGQVSLSLQSDKNPNLLALDGRVELGISDLPRFAKWAGIDVPADAQKGTYQQLTANLPFRATEKFVAVRSLRMTLDRSTLSGAVDYDMQANPAKLSFDLTVDQFNADDYMNTGTDIAPQNAAAKKAPTTAAADAGEITVPDIAVTGKFAVGALTYGGTTYRQVLLQTDVAAENNRVNAQLGFRALPYQLMVKADYDPALGQARLDSLTFASNKSRLSGTALVTGMSDGKRPQFKAALSGPYLDMNDVVPATVDSKGRASNNNSAPANSDRWSREPLPFAPLRTVDGTFTLALDRFIGFGLDISDMKGEASLNKGVLKLEDFTGALFGGPMQASGTFDASQDRSTMLFDLVVKNADLEKVDLGFWRKGRFAGLVDGTMTFNSSGASMFDLVKGLKGDVKFAGEKGALRGMDLRKLAFAVRNFDKGGAAQIPAALTKGETPFNDLDMWLQFVDGVMTSKQIKTDVGSDVRMATDLMLDLPNWHANFATGFFLVEKKDMPPISLLFKGPPDNLKRKLDTEAIKKYYLNSLVKKGVQKLFKF